MALKKSQLYGALWKSCDELRGSMDPSQYKDYVLTLLFMKYVSDKYSEQDNPLMEIPAGASFADLVKLEGDKEIGDKINKIIAKVAESNDLKGVIDQADFNDATKLGSGKEMQDRLSKLVKIFAPFNFHANHAEGDDLLGDAYEYLMRHFATESGKSKGQFYTPAEVSHIIAQVISIENAQAITSPTVYDPTCGSGSLLIKAAQRSTAKNIAIYGQEKDNATWALARMNMILHGHDTAHLQQGNTLSSPYFKGGDAKLPSHSGLTALAEPADGYAINLKNRLKTFNFAVANPPFSVKSWSSGFDPDNDPYERFADGVPPAEKGDYAFLLHLIRSLKSNGKGAIILPHGVLFRGNREAMIRKKLIQRGFIKGIIGLPANLFYGTGIPACIIVIDKENARVRNGLFMIDASKGFIKDGNKNRLRTRDLHKIVDVFTNQTELLCYSRMVPIAEIEIPANDYNLNLPRYIDSSETEDLHDLHAHVGGGIPQSDIDALNAYWEVFPSLPAILLAPAVRAGYSIVRKSLLELKQHLATNEDVIAYQQRVTRIFSDWRTAHTPTLHQLSRGDCPKDIIHTLSETLLCRFEGLPLLDKYDLYQRLMDYWSNTMQDDVYLIVGNGWSKAAQPRRIIGNHQRKLHEAPDITVAGSKYKLELIPPSLIAAHHFSDTQTKLNGLQATQNAASRELEAYTEEHTATDGLLESVTNDKGIITNILIKKQLAAICHYPQHNQQRQVLRHCQRLFDTKAAASKATKQAQTDLNQKLLATYRDLSEQQIKHLVVEHKWFATIAAEIEDQLQHITLRLLQRITELNQRYADPLPDLETEAARLSQQVAAHLRKMGVNG